MKLIADSRGGTLWRFALGAFLVISFAAATTAVAGLLEFKQLAKDISGQAPIKGVHITVAQAGDPQTILLIGSDHRAGTPFYDARTDTMMLVRLNANSKTINVISIPRDLKVQIPEGGVLVTNKLNAAYSAGGPGLLVKVLKSQVFPGLHINHVIDVNFGGFVKLINAIGCVYTDVDHRYYNNTAVTDYSSIDIQPGYEKLCGDDALAFVRFRHTDSDIVRNARQQDFLRWTKSQYSVGQVVSNRDRLLTIFGKHAQTDPDLHTSDGVEKLFELVAFSAGHQIKQVPFPAQLESCSAGGQTPCYVTADSVLEAAAFRAFMHVTVTAPGSTKTNTAHKSRKGKAPAFSTAGLTADPGDGRSQSAQLGRIHMPVYYPRLIASGTNYCFSITANCPVQSNTAHPSYPRAYTLHDQSGRPYSAYRFTLEINPILGQYYGVQGMAWKTPPILRSPSGFKTVAGRRLALYYNGQHISVVAWHTPTGVYWISNSLTDTIGNSQMIGMAATFTRAAGIG